MEINFSLQPTFFRKSSVNFDVEFVLYSNYNNLENKDYRQGKKVNYGSMSVDKLSY